MAYYVHSQFTDSGTFARHVLSGFNAINTSANLAAAIRNVINEREEFHEVFKRNSRRRQSIRAIIDMISMFKLFSNG